MVIVKKVNFAAFLFNYETKLFAQSTLLQFLKILILTAYFTHQFQ